MNRLFEKYNTPETVLVITSFPTKSRRNFNAVSWHSEKTLTLTAERRKVLVCAEKNGRAKISEGKNLLVIPAWEKGNLFSFISLYFLMRRLRLIQSIFVQFEFNVFGGIIPNLMLLLLLFALRLTGKQVTFELHQVIFDVKKLAKHVNITNPVKQMILNTGLKLYYFLLGQIASSVIVFEQELKDRLMLYINHDKIYALNLFTEGKTVTEINSAKRKLGLATNEFTILVFGFINGYKGIDWIIEAFNLFKKSKVRLLLVGGKNPYLKDKMFYQKFYQSIMDKVKQNPQITQVGFVPDDKVSLYFSAADLVAIPYEVFMSASGPYSLALSCQKPVILSEVLADYGKSLDFKKAMAETQLSFNEIFFPLRAKQFKLLVERVRENKILYQKLVKFSKDLQEYRSSEVTIDKLDQILFYGGTVKNITYTPEPLLVKL